MDLRESAAALLLGILPPERLPEIALSAMEDGLDSPSLATLAGSSDRVDPQELRSLFAHAYRELALPPPSQIDSAQILKRHYAAQVGARVLAPREGASLIVERVFRQVDALLPCGAYVGESFGIAHLVGLFYNYDDVPITDQGSIAKIDQAIVEECQRIANEQVA